MIDLSTRQLRKIKHALEQLDLLAQHGDLEASKLADQIGTVIDGRVASQAEIARPGTMRIELHTPGRSELR